MLTDTFPKVTTALRQILPIGKEGDSHDTQATVFDLIPVNGTGYIKFRGCFWLARCFQQVSLEPNMVVKVIDREGLTLIVEPVSTYAESFNLMPQNSPYIDD